jgi:hypothetical protein
VEDIDLVSAVVEIPLGSSRLMDGDNVAAVRNNGSSEMSGV